MNLNIVKLSLITLALFAFSLSTYAQEKKKPNPEKVFKRFDLNEDGAITLEEFKNAKRKNEITEEILEKRFNRMDGDKDGLVTLDELKANFAKAKKKNKE